MKLVNLLILVFFWGWMMGGAGPGWAQNQESAPPPLLVPGTEEPAAAKPGFWNGFQEKMQEELAKIDYRKSILMAGAAIISYQLVFRLFESPATAVSMLEGAKRLTLIMAAFGASRAIGWAYDLSQGNGLPLSEEFRSQPRWPQPR
jgi:hypothetical protein